MRAVRLNKHSVRTDNNVGHMWKVLVGCEKCCTSGLTGAWLLVGYVKQDNTDHDWEAVITNIVYPLDVRRVVRTSM